MWWVGLGGALNFVAIAANGGVMPANPGAVATAGVRIGEGFSNSALVSDPRLPFLGDIFPLPLPGRLANVASLGDAVICAGIFLAVHRLTGSRLVRPASGLAAGLVTRPRLRTVGVAHALGWTGAWLMSAAVVIVTIGTEGALASGVAMGLAGLCAGLMLGGPLVDRFNRPALLACATFGQACAAGLLLIWPSTSFVGVAAVIVGFGTGLAQPAAFALLAEAVEPERRTAALAGLVGLSAGVSVIAAGFPLALVRSGGARPVLGAATLACGLAALAWSITPASRRSAPRRATLWKDLMLAIRALEDTPSLARLALLAAALGCGVGLAASDPFVAAGLAWRRATPLGLAAGSLATGVIIGALACTAARRPRAALGPAFALTGAGLFVGATGGTASWALASWAIGGAGAGATGVLLASATLALAAEPLCGRLLSVVLAGQLLGLGTGYTLGGSLDKSGGPVAAGAAAGIALFAAAVVAGRLKEPESISKPGINDAEEVLPAGEAPEVLAEQPEQTVVRLPDSGVGDMGGNQTVVESPQGVTRGEGLGVGDVEPGATQPSRAESLDEVVRDDVAPPGDVDQVSPWAEGVHLLTADDALRLRGQGESNEGHEGTGESAHEVARADGPCRTCQWLGLSSDDCCLHAEGVELLEEGPGDTAASDDGHLGAVERARSLGG